MLNLLVSCYSNCSGLMFWPISWQKKRRNSSNFQNIIVIPNIERPKIDLVPTTIINEQEQVGEIFDKKKEIKQQKIKKFSTKNLKKKKLRINKLKNDEIKPKTSSIIIQVEENELNINNIPFETPVINKIIDENLLSQKQNSQTQVIK